MNISITAFSYLRKPLSHQYKYFGSNWSKWTM